MSREDTDTMTSVGAYLVAGLLAVGAVLAPYTVVVEWPAPESAPPPVIETLDCATDSECEESEATLEPWAWALESGINPDEWYQQ